MSFALTSSQRAKEELPSHEEGEGLRRLIRTNTFPSKPFFLRFRAFYVCVQQLMGGKMRIIAMFTERSWKRTAIYQIISLLVFHLP